MPASKVSDLTLGGFLKIVQKTGVYVNLPDASALWDFTKKSLTKEAPAGKQLDFKLLTAYGASAAGPIAVSGGDFHAPRKTKNQTGTVEFKDFAVTIEAENTVIEKAQKDFARYGAPLATEIEAKTLVSKRLKSAIMVQDGTGVLGTVASASVSGGKLAVVLDVTDAARGHIGWFEEEDLTRVYEPAGTTSQAPTVSSGTFSYFQVDDTDRDTNTVTLAAYDASGSQLTVTAANAVGAGDLIYRSIQATIPDLSSAPAVDYNTLSENWIGLGSLSEDDGRICNNVTQSGATKATRKSCGGKPIDSRHFQQLASKLTNRTGNKYQGKYNRAWMASETMDNLVDARETDRKFVSVKDNKRGVEGLGYIAGKNQIMFEQDEFMPKTKIYLFPDSEVLCHLGAEMKFVTDEKGSKFHLKPSANGGHSRMKVAYMEGSDALYSTHSAAIGALEDFSITTD